MLNRERVFRTLTTLDIFMDRALKLRPKSPELSGFHYNREMLRAAMANTYLETVGSRADSIQMAVKSAPMSDIYWEYLKTVKVLRKRTSFAEHDAVLAFDTTDEDFYGHPETMWIHNWTGEDAVTGKFRFLTCSLVSHDVPEKVPLFSIPVQIGHSNARDVTFMLAMVKPLFKSVSLCLFDRGYHSNEMFLTLTNAHIPYLIFLRKDRYVKELLGPMKSGDMRTVDHEFKLNKDKTVIRGETTVALLRQIFRRGEYNDWCFATNRREIDLENIVSTYTQRWNIETGFRIQDEATIKSKSKDVRIRFFLFTYEQVLQLLWAVLFKEEVSFKEFLIQLSDTCSERLSRAEMKALNSGSRQ